MPDGPTPYSPPEIDFEDFPRVLEHKSMADLRAANFVLWTIRKPRMMKTGRLLARVGLALRIPGTMSALERTVFRQFCGGTNLEQAVARAAELYPHGIRCILDYAVEGEDSDDDFDAVAAEIGRVIDATSERPEIVLLAIKVSGMARFDLLAKVASSSELDGDEHAEWERSQARLEAVAARAADANVGVFVDAEHSWIQPAIDAEVTRLMRTYNRERAVVHTTVQMYLRDRLPVLAQMIEDTRAGGYHLGIKLVRGAYMEQERARAEELGYESPIQLDKAATDADYDRGLTLCLENLDVVTLCAATHNVASTRHLIAEMGRLGIQPDDARVTASQLLGMFDRVTYPLAEHGYNALKYVPYGRVREAFPYLLRRADENKSVADQLATELEAIREEIRRRGKNPL